MTATSVIEEIEKRHRDAEEQRRDLLLTSKGSIHEVHADRATLLALVRTEYARGLEDAARLVERAGEENEIMAEMIATDDVANRIRALLPTPEEVAGQGASLTARKGSGA